jgi:hypothetical protein
VIQTLTFKVIQMKIKKTKNTNMKKSKKRQTKSLAIFTAKIKSRRKTKKHIINNIQKRRSINSLNTFTIQPCLSFFKGDTLRNTKDKKLLGFWPNKSIMIRLLFRLSSKRSKSWRRKGSLLIAVTKSCLKLSSKKILKWRQ